MITQPLDLARHLRPAPRNFDLYFYFNVGLLVLFLSLFVTRFVLAPGMPISVPEMNGAVEWARTTGRVVNLQRDNRVLFEGGRYTVDGFQRRLAEMVAAQGTTRLLLRVDRQTSAQALVTVVAVATGAGCDVQIAAEAPEQGLSEP
jgi:biopolymer transport protein ExbD